ncbi:DoxX family protein [Kitasatospora sp. NPDC097643]|uniref:DoxX family protein n=1 Tax=Kitasatospora sp. NPDC097643 TaxID=3157230 RepID=UPI00331DAFEC
MNVFLWILQGLLAAFFAMVGLMKATQPKAKLAKSLPWVEDFTPGAVKAIGAVEFLGALALVLPAAIGTATALTPLAATGLALTMAGAAIVHARRKEHSVIGMNVLLLILAAVVAWGRFGPYHF